jgi:hypothetical protein
MQLVANQQLVKNRVRLGAAFHIGAFALFVVALFVTTTQANQTDVPRETQVFSWLAIFVGMGLYWFGQTQLRRWGPRNRQEEQLGQSIRGLDDRYKLYAFMSSSLPDYILVSPAGVHVLLIRPEGGQVSCVRDRWSRAAGRLGGLFGSGVGNPTADVQRQVNQVRALLTREGAETQIPIAGLVVFTNPAVTLRVEACSIAVTRLKDLKDLLRRAAGKGQNVALPAARVREVQAIFDRHMQTAHSWR